MLEESAEQVIKYMHIALPAFINTIEILDFTDLFDING